ncbi:unnamed protein product [Thlaspi arvense]|uniref:Uncharacterized protein n=1 Tax=Thlaspi arvense TaxID=13288 RepID=A0AAU9SYL2_THLAR|nr:unnamed protein product [Thlaspi arvense]
MRSLLLSLHRITPLSRHQRYAFTPFHEKVAGPLVEYERRIVAEELLDGDLCQLGILRELQRLYNELVQYADACRLDRYSASAKPTRFLG